MPSRLLDAFAARQLIVLGDVILDRYWWGDSTRLSPEAPVPIVRKQRTTSRAGGAANTAANLVSLGAAADLFGVIGLDAAGAELRDAVRQCGITAVLIEDVARPTTSKTRIIAHQQQVVRVDEEETMPLADALTARVVDSASALMSQRHAVVLSDYGKGFLTPQLVRSVIEAAGRARIPTFVDPKGADYQAYLGCTLLKPNRLELGILMHHPVRTRDETREAGSKLRSLMPGTSILVTEGAEGMTLFSADGSEEHADSILKQVFDVTGAGDTVLATVALALTSGATPKEALGLASHAASIVVGVLGTATVTREQLAAAL